MKPSSLVLIIGVAALLADAWLGVTYFQEQRAKESLASQLDVAGESPGEDAPTASLQERRAAAEAQLNDEEAAFPDKVASATTVGYLLQLSQQCGVDILDMKTQPGKDLRRGNSVYSALSIHMQVQGGLSELQTYMSTLERAETLKAVALEEVSIVQLGTRPVVSLGLSVWSRH